MMTINDFALFAWQWCIPPLNERKPHSIFSMVFLFGVICLPTLAAYIRIRHPSLSFHWKLTYFICLVPIVLRTCFLRYTHFNDLDKPSLNYGNGDAYIGGCALSILIFTIDFLFLARDDEQNVRHSDEYKKWIQDKYETNGNHTTNGNGNTNGHRPTKAEKDIESITGGKGYTLEQPKYFPGTNAWLPFDMAMSPRGIGYIRGHSQRECLYQAGYRALIASEKLKLLSQTKQKELKMLKLKHLIRIGGELCYSIVIMDAIMAILTHPSLIGISKHIQTNNNFIFLSESTKSSTLGPFITPWFSAILVGSAIPIRMQMIHLFVYFFTLLFTHPIRIPITISRFEPLLCPNFANCTSIQALWSQGWHQLPRRMYTIIAMRPSMKLASKLKIDLIYGRGLGYLIAFFISGIMHELSLEGLIAHIPHLNENGYRSMNESELRKKGFGFGAKNYVSTRFFVIQAFIIIFEEIWSNQLESFLANKIFGGKGNLKLIKNPFQRKILGWIWCTFWMTFPGMAMIDVWAAHGIMSPITKSRIFSPLLDFITFSKT